MPDKGESTGVVTKVVSVKAQESWGREGTQNTAERLCPNTKQVQNE